MCGLTHVYSIFHAEEVYSSGGNSVPIQLCDMNVNTQAQSKKTNNVPQKNENEHTQIDVIR